MEQKKVFTSFDEQDMKEFEPEAKVGLIATVNPGGLPHITLITALQAKTSQQLIWGQFSDGLSKKHVKTNPKTGFLIMTLSRSLWRGKALWTQEQTHGEDYEMFNLKPMFRYNAYFGIHTVHYMNLVETYGRESLPMVNIILASLLTKLAKSSACSRNQRRILKPWAEGLFNRLDSLKFLSFIGEDGFPVIIPLIQCQAGDSTRLAFSPLAYGKELSVLKKGMPAAVFGLTMDMEDVLVRGVFGGVATYRMTNLGVLDIEWVYNSMPPVQGQIYPEVELKPVMNF
ncbi:MAG TPA: pyridoxamine 5'-phosphate oxidase family protein [Deltaproteobacteria bacterium]|nr:pyridoxamine 5'-phosphate oxidase family protein [Deltaproteobacteria bacterium]